MAKRKTKTPKMSAGEALKILANESKQIKENINVMWQNIQRLDVIQKDTIALFEHYIEHTKDGKSFIKKMDKLIKERLDEQKANEQADGQDTEGDKQDETVGAEGVRTQEG